jgi:uncharacterized protein YihD (DUF1040 family)
MIKIAHRGNTDGPKKELENSPDYIYDAIDAGFDVEVDIWSVDGVLYLGHDTPQYMVEDSFVISILPHAWFHCKNIEILDRLVNIKQVVRFFWHQEDDYTLTNNGLIWTYPGKEITANTIIVHLEKFNEEDFKTKPFAICSDFLI